LPRVENPPVGKRYVGHKVQLPQLTRETNNSGVEVPIHQPPLDRDAVRAGIQHSGAQPEGPDRSGRLRPRLGRLLRRGALGRSGGTSAPRRPGRSFRALGSLGSLRPGRTCLLSRPAEGVALCSGDAEGDVESVVGATLTLGPGDDKVNGPAGLPVGAV